MQLLAIRHPPVAESGLCYGRRDLFAPLSDEAAAFVTESVRTASGRVGPFEVVWSSPARRCRRLADRLSEALNISRREDARLWEMSFGAWEGRPWSELEREPSFGHWMRDWQRVAPPGGESLPELEARVVAWCDEFGRRPAVVVTHAGVIRALRVAVGGWCWEDAMRETVPHLVPLPFELPRRSS